MSSPAGKPGANCPIGVSPTHRFCGGGENKIARILFPPFFGLASHNQAERVCKNALLFEHEYGFATCDHAYAYNDRQWNYPLGWAPLHYVVYNGLKRYGHREDASRVALKWLNLVYSVWRKTNKVFEKYDVVRGTHEVLTDRYKNQEGFGWTNAVFHLLVSEEA